MTKKQPVQQQHQQQEHKQNHHNTQSNYKYQSNDDGNNNNKSTLINKQWYRLTYYTIQNRVYRLVDDHDQINNQTNNYIHNSNINNNRNNQNLMDQIDLQNDFRQPSIRTNTNSMNNNNRSNTSNVNINNRQEVNNNNSLSIFSRRSNNTQIQRQPSDNRSYKSSIFTSLTTLLHHIHSIQLPTLLSYLPFLHPKPTLYSQYKNKSQAILNNSIDLQQAIVKALQYNIPLMQIVMKNNLNNINNKNNNMNKDNRQRQQQIVWQRVLDNFTIAHFINQNFVLYGDWSYQKYRDIFQSNYNNMYVNEQQNHHKNNTVSNELDNNNKQTKQQQSGRILFRRGSLVFGQIDIQGICNISQQQLLQKLQMMRNRYYQLKHLANSKISNYSQSSSISTNNYNIKPEHINKVQYSFDNLGNKLYQKQQKYQYQYQHQHQDLYQQQQQQNNENPPSAERIKSIQDQILNDYLQQKKLQQELIQIQNDQQQQQNIIINLNTGNINHAFNNYLNQYIDGQSNSLSQSQSYRQNNMNSNNQSYSQTNNPSYYNQQQQANQHFHNHNNNNNPMIYTPQNLLIQSRKNHHQHQQQKQQQQKPQQHSYHYMLPKVEDLE